MKAEDRIVVESKAPYYTLVSNPFVFFQTRRYTLGWIRVAAVVAIGESLLARIQAPYTFSAPLYHSLFVHKTPAQVATLKSQALAASPVEAFFNVGIALLITTVILWLVARAFSNRMLFRHILAIVAHASVIALIGAVVSTAATVLTGHLVSDFLSLGMFAQAGSRAQAVFGGIGVFNLWMLWVEMAGVAAVAGITLRKAAAPVLVSWLLLLLMSAGL